MLDFSDKYRAACRVCQQRQAELWDQGEDDGLHLFLPFVMLKARAFCLSDYKTESELKSACDTLLPEIDIPSSDLDSLWHQLRSVLADKANFMAIVVARWSPLDATPRVHVEPRKFADIVGDL